MRRSMFFLPLLLPAVLSACTGTTEDAVTIRLAVLSGTGSAAALSTVDVGKTGVQQTASVPNAVDLATLPGGNKLALLYTDHLETRDANLANPVSQPNPTDAAFRPCYVKLEVSAALDRLAALSDCGNGALQQVVVWRSDGSVSFSATLPAPTPSTPRQTRLAVQGDTVWAVHPAVGSGSELLRVSRNSDGSSSLASPVSVPTINDLAFFKGALYAAVSSGVQTLSSSGTLTALPATTQLNTPASNLYSSDRLLGAWQSGSSAPLLIWNGSKTGIPAYFSDLRDVTYAPDATLYSLDATTLTQFDSAYGLAGNGWRNTPLATFNNPRAVTWLVPIAAPVSPPAQP
ncbi:hypothetical protein EHF33_10265 [Deinococcus psychrotolerans]|uniref:Lipoprotein n=1 Tax=Deinococcus psychrotolerans TaxID=2489213 RepID=A0A3G8YCG7_9DEIO|nr:hypothetical protein [Deinococcus psychrotolerans]AZI43079.1 hypothetical protein EHF33_10265 [Deinococcus psychrotolerans]